MKVNARSIASLAVSILAALPFVTGTNDLEIGLVSQDTVKKICRNQRLTVESVTQMRQIIRLGRELCHRDYQAALNELEPILSIEEGELCTEQTFELIRDFHFRFINIPEYVNDKPGQYEKEKTRIVYRQLHPEPHSYTVNLDEYDEPLMIPISLRHFFLSFALQVSGLCKRAMLANLESIYPLDEMIKDETSIMGLLGSTTSALNGLLVQDMKEINFDNVVYLPELEGKSAILEKADLKSTGKQVHMQVDFTKNSALYELMMDCKNHLQPIYNTLIMPVVRLNKLGYDYLGDKLSEEEHRKLEDINMKIWLGAVHICEIFRNIMLVGKENVDDESQDEGDDFDLDNFVFTDDEDDDDDDDDDVDHTSKNSMPDSSNTENPALVTESNVDDSSTAIKIKEAEILEVAAKTHLKPMSAEQVEDLESIDKIPLPEVTYCKLSVPVEPFGNDLWILSEQQLDLELSRKWGHTQPFGWRGFLRKLFATIKKMIATLDFNQFASWRKHSTWYQGILSLLCMLLSVTNVTLTIVGYIAPGAIG